MVMSVNLGMLDDLGLAYPSGDWTYLDAERLWRTVSGVRGGKHVYGANLSLSLAVNWWPNAWGGAIGTPDGTRCLLNRAPAVSAYEWFVPLVRANVVSDAGNIYAGTAGFALSGGWNIQNDLVNLSGYKWDYFGAPHYPAGQATFINSDFYGMNRYSRNPRELVWDIFKFLVLDTGFQELQFKTTFITPNRIDLWDTWLHIIYAIAPVLRTKNLRTYAQAVEYATPRYQFKYENDTAVALEQRYFDLMTAGKMSVPLALDETARRIDAIEAGAARSSAAAAAAEATTHRLIDLAAAGRLHVFPRPTGPGYGLPYAPDARALTRLGSAYVLDGSGAGLFYVVVSLDVGHRFRSMPATHFGACRPGISVHAGRLWVQAEMVADMAR